MKIKVDKDEYELLLERVTKLEEEIRDENFSLFENWKWTRETLYDMMKHYFNNRARTILIKRDKDKIVGELRALALDNLFKEKDGGTD